MSDFERHAIQLLVDRATAAGVPVPSEVRSALDGLGHVGSGGAVAWVEAHPDEDSWPVEALICCTSAGYRGPESCTCWKPIYEVRQQTPQPPTCAADMSAAPRMCGDCAFRKGSPERSDAWTEEALMDLTVSGTPFYCHSGMRRPTRWVHPTLGEVEGSTADWQPPIIAGIPYQVDGSPGLLCAGWVARAARFDVEVAT